MTIETAIIPRADIRNYSKILAALPEGTRIIVRDVPDVRGILHTHVHVKIARGWSTDGAQYNNAMMARVCLKHEGRVAIK